MEFLIGVSITVSILLFIILAHDVLYDIWRLINVSCNKWCIRFRKR